MSMAIVKIAGREVCAVEELVHGYQPGGDDMDIDGNISRMFITVICVENVDSILYQVDSILNQVGIENWTRTIVDRSKPIYGTKTGDLLPFDAVEEGRTK